MWQMLPSTYSMLIYFWKLLRFRSFQLVLHKFTLILIWTSYFVLWQLKVHDLHVTEDGDLYALIKWNDWQRWCKSSIYLTNWVMYLNVLLLTYFDFCTALHSGFGGTYYLGQLVSVTNPRCNEWCQMLLAIMCLLWSSVFGVILQLFACGSTHYLLSFNGVH